MKTAKIGKVRPREGICPKCKEHTLLTRHHYRPVRFFGRQNNKQILLICSDCHSMLERLIPQREQMPVTFYFSIVELFLK